MEKIRVAVVGAGRMGQMHAQNLAWRVPEAQVTVVADAAPTDAAQRCAEPLGARWTRDVSAIFSDSAVDAVVISTPTPTHVDFIVAAARGGKHVFCEKPVAIEPSGVDRAMEACRNAGVQLQIGFNRRFDPSFARAHARIHSGELGTPVMLSLWHCDASVPPLEYLRTSGGIFRDMLIHDFDEARWLMGRKVTEVTAHGSCLVEPAIAEMGDCDTAIVTLRFEGGVLAVLRGCRNHVTGHDVSAEMLLTRGAVRVENPPQTAVTVLGVAGAQTDRWSGSFLERFEKAYVAEMAAFAHALRHEEPVPVGGEAAREALVLAHAATESYQTGRTIKLGEKHAS